MFHIFFYLTYKTLILLIFVFGVALASSALDARNQEDCITEKEQISEIKAQCKKDYEKVQSYCTERGLAMIQTISIGGQTVANAINILKADGKPGSAKKVMGMSKKLSYGLGALNAGVGAKCLSNIRSCSSSCERAEKTKECLETLQAPSNNLSILINILNTVEGHSFACKQLKSNAYSALAQGVLHGATGLIQAEMEKSLGRKAEEEENSANTESEAFNPPEPNPPGTSPLSGEPGVNLNDGNTADNTDEVGEFAGNQIHENPSENKKGLDNDINEGYRGVDSASENSETFSSAPYGSSGSASSTGNIPFSSGDLGQGGIGSDNLHEEEEGAENTSYGNGGAGGFAASPLSKGGSGGDYYGGDDGGYYEEEPLEGEASTPEETAEKTEEEELEQLRKSIGGKHESIFEKASKTLANYCMEGPLKCE